MLTISAEARLGGDSPVSRNGTLPGTLPILVTHCIVWPFIQNSAAPTGALLDGISDAPLRETRTAFFGGRGAKAQICKGGVQWSAVKDDRRGGAPGLHKRGFASAEDRGGGREGRPA